MRSVAFLLPVVVAALLSGCATAPPATGSQRLASVVIEGAAADKIKESVLTVFKRESFALARPAEDKLVFERPGTFLNGLAYGDWYGGGVYERVEVFQKELEPGRTLLDCNAFMVQEPEDPFFEKVRPVSKSRRGRYQKLLEAAAAALSQASVAPAAPR